MATPCGRGGEGMCEYRKAVTNGIPLCEPLGEYCTMCVLGNMEMYLRIKEREQEDTDRSRRGRPAVWRRLFTKC